MKTESNNMLRCKVCCQEKPTSEFTRRSQSKTGFQWKCKSCTKEYRRNNKEKINEYGRTYLSEYYQNNKESYKEWSKRFRLANPEYIKEYNKGYYRNNKVRFKDSTLKSRYGITQLEYDRMYQIQQGKCMICGTHQTDLTQKLGVDHDHQTHRVRDLLCSNCNKGLGIFRDDPGLLIAAAEYLFKHKKTD